MHELPDHAPVLRVISIEDPEKLISFWEATNISASSIGLVLNGDKLLRKFLRMRGNIRILILRPYLESRNIAGLLRFLIKKSLIALLIRRKNIDLTQLSIPFSRDGRKSTNWVKDDFNINLFDSATANDNSLVGIYESNVVEVSKIITIVGFLDMRKNPRLVYETFSKLREIQGENVKLALIGKQSCEWKKVTAFWNFDGIIQVDRYLSDQELKYVLQRSTVTILPYSNRGASGVAINSLVLGAPVVISGTRNWINAQKALRNQLIRSKLNVDSFCQAIESAFHAPRMPLRQELTSEPLQDLSDFLLNGTHARTKGLKRLP
jgi:hypothetical protein